MLLQYEIKKDIKLQRDMLNIHKHFIFKHSYQFITREHKQCYNIYTKNIIYIKILEVSQSFIYNFIKSNFNVIHKFVLKNISVFL